MPTSGMLGQFISVAVLLCLQNVLIHLSGGYKDEFVIDMLPQVMTVLFYLQIRLFVKTARPMSTSVNQSALLASLLCLPALIHSYSADIKHQTFNFLVMIFAFLIFTTRQYRFHIIIKILLYLLFTIIIAYGHILLHATVKLYGIIAWISYTLYLLHTPTNIVKSQTLTLFGILTFLSTIILNNNIFADHQLLYGIVAFNRRILHHAQLFTNTPSTISVNVLLELLFSPDGWEHLLAEFSYYSNSLYSTSSAFLQDCYVAYQDHLPFSLPKEFLLRHETADGMDNTNDGFEPFLTQQDLIEIASFFFILYLFGSIGYTLLHSLLPIKKSSSHFEQNVAAEDTWKRQGLHGSIWNTEHVRYLCVILYLLNWTRKEVEEGEGYATTVSERLFPSCSLLTISLDPIVLLCMANSVVLLIHDIKYLSYLPSWSRIAAFDGYSLAVRFPYYISADALVHNHTSVKDTFPLILPHMIHKHHQSQEWMYLWVERLIYIWIAIQVCLGCLQSV